MENTTEIRNIKRYLRAVLFNASAPPSLCVYALSPTTWQAHGEAEACRLHLQQAKACKGGSTMKRAHCFDETADRCDDIRFDMPITGRLRARPAWRYSWRWNTTTLECRRQLKVSLVCHAEGGLTGTAYWLPDLSGAESADGGHYFYALSSAAHITAGQ